MAKTACPRLTITTKLFGSRLAEIRASTADAKIVGKLQLEAVSEWNDVKNATALQVLHIWVDPKLQRCGLGTALYETGVKLARKQKRFMVSDELRSMCADQFWQKQVKKGRAVCDKRWPEKPQTHYADDESFCGKPIRGRSGCQYYRMKTTATTLSGRRKRR